MGKNKKEIMKAFFFYSCLMDDLNAFPLENYSIQDILLDLGMTFDCQ